MKGRPPLRGTWIAGHAGMFFRIARNAYEASAAHKPEAKPTWNAATAIVFCQASLEAFINEIIASARVVRDAHPNVRQFASVGEEVVKREVNIAVRFLLARATFAGDPYDKGSNPYADFAFLNKLRNDLIHMTPLTVDEDVSGNLHGEPSKGIMEGLKQRGLLGPGSSIRVPAQARDWTDWIKSPELERWACKTTALMVRSILDVIPAGAFKQFVNGYYDEFEPFIRE